MVFRGTGRDDQSIATAFGCLHPWWRALAVLWIYLACFTWAFTDIPWGSPATAAPQGTAGEVFLSVILLRNPAHSSIYCISKLMDILCSSVKIWNLLSERKSPGWRHCHCHLLMHRDQQVQLRLIDHPGTVGFASHHMKERWKIDSDSVQSTERKYPVPQRSLKSSWQHFEIFILWSIRRHKKGCFYLSFLLLLFLFYCNRNQCIIGKTWRFCLTGMYQHSWG